VKNSDQEAHGHSHSPTRVSGRNQDKAVHEEHGHGHSHGPNKTRRRSRNPSQDDSGEHGHAHASRHASSSSQKDDHGHSHGQGDHGHSHGQDKGGVEVHIHEEDFGAHSGGGRDHNMWGLFIHFLGDVLTSLLVLGVGLSYYFTQPPAADANPRDDWVNYMDPAASVLSAMIIFISAWPLVKACSWILLQSSPAHIDLSRLRTAVLRVRNVTGVHELHVWQLVDGLTIASVHVVVVRSSSFEKVVEGVKKVLHRFGIHSSTIQPEVEAATAVRSQSATSCVTATGNCIRDCAEETCCPVVEDDAEHSVA